MLAVDYDILGSVQLLCRSTQRFTHVPSASSHSTRCPRRVEHHESAIDELVSPQGRREGILKRCHVAR